MIDMKACQWLMDNADAPIRYRVSRELLQDKKTAKKTEDELLSHRTVQLWLSRLNPETPAQHWSMEHGSFDFCLENALLKIVQLGLHGGFAPVADALGYYVNRVQTTEAMDYYIGRMKDIGVTYRTGRNFPAILAANCLSLTGIKDEATRQYMLGSLDEMYRFAKKRIYDIYLSEEERKKLTKVPANWKNATHFIRPSLIREYGFSFPLIYDVIGLHALYALKDPEVDQKINTVIRYISSDKFHRSIADGYGVLAEEDVKYHGMGWDPKYPGWFDLPRYLETAQVPKLLFFAQYIVKYSGAADAKWTGDLLDYLERFKTEAGTYLFPAGWLKESPGYAVLGRHLSFGENRRKKNWKEIESTFYVQLLRKN